VRWPLAGILRLVPAT